MDTRQLEYVLAIAEEQNLSRAAERLFLSQSALSQQLAKLEADGLPPLFKRTKGKMILTDAGKIYVNGARTILKLNNDVEQQLKDLDSGTVRRLNIAVCQRLQPLYYRRILPWLKHSYPKIAITTLTPQVGHVRHTVENGDVDLVLLTSDYSFHDILHYLILREEELVLASLPSLADIALPLVLPAKGTHLRRLCDKAATQCQMQRAVYAEPEDAESAIVLAKLGECVAMLPRSEAAGSGLFLASLEPSFTFYTVAITRRGTMSPLLSDICNWLKKVFSEGENI